MTADGSGYITIDFALGGSSDNAHLNGMCIATAEPLTADVFIDCSTYYTNVNHHQTTPVDRYWNEIERHKDVDDLVDVTNDATTVDFKVTDHFVNRNQYGTEDSALASTPTTATIKPTVRPAGTRAS